MKKELFEERFLNSQVKKALTIYKPKIDVKSKEIQNIIRIVQDFISKKELLCYGGTAINNILPPEKAFYNYEEEIPDYDVFSKNAIKDVKELADIYYKNGFENVEAKAALHHGTYKVYVNFIDIIDITNMDKSFFDNLKKESLNFIKNTQSNYLKIQYQKSQILYCPPNFLRAQFYNELSDPSGNVQRWTKIYPRLKVFDEVYPLNVNCLILDPPTPTDKIIHNKVLSVLKKTNIDYILCGALAFSIIVKKKIQSIGFQLLTYQKEELTNQIIDELGKNGLYVTISRTKENDFIGDTNTIKINEKIVCNIINVLRCHSYITIEYSNHKFNVGSIDTLLYLFLTFSFIRKNNILNNDTYLCMCEYLLNYQNIQISKNRNLMTKGSLSKFNINCKGPILTKESRRNNQSKIYKKYSKDKSPKGRKIYEKYFLKYSPRKRSEI
jgi:hypothetical protein